MVKQTTISKHNRSLKMAKDILIDLGLKKPANFNNNNNNNNNNDNNNKITTNTLGWSRDQDKEKMNLTSSSLESLREEKSVGQKKVTEKLPPEWKGIKLDLFCNGYNRDGSLKLKMNVSILRRLDGARFELQASLNSSWDDGVRRGVDKTAWNTESHWIRVKQHRKELQLLYDIRASKIGKKTKGGGTEWVAFVYQDFDKLWCADIVRESQTLQFKLNTNFSAAQIAQGNMIGTGYFGDRSQGLINPRKEWGI